MTPSRPMSPQIAGQRRISRFSTSAGLGLIAVTAIAVIALGLLLLPPGDTPPIAVVSPTPTFELATPSPEVTPTGPPPPTPLATPTPQPTATPPAAWTGLTWSTGVAPFVPNTWFIADAVSSDGVLVGVGGTAERCDRLGTVYVSTDGLHWEIAYQAELPTEWYFEHVVPLGDGLLAISNARPASGDCPSGAEPSHAADLPPAPRLWTSSDGSAWSEIDSVTWNDAFAPWVIRDVVGGDAGVVAVSFSGVVAHTNDGEVWQVAEELPSQNGVVIRDVLAHAGGFVIVGRDGARDPVVEAGPQPPPGVGRPAAWVSSDGVHWAQADVEGVEVPGGELQEVAAGGHGLFATGIATATEVQYADPTTGWVSVDGLRWHQVAELGTDLPAVANGLPDITSLVGDGTRIALFGRASQESDALAVAVSTDGITWTRPAFTGAVTNLRIGTWDETAPDEVSFVVDPLVLRDGLFVRAWGGSTQVFWVALAIER